MQALDLVAAAVTGLAAVVSLASGLLALSGRRATAGRSATGSFAVAWTAAWSCAAVVTGSGLADGVVFLSALALLVLELRARPGGLSGRVER